MTYWKDSLLIGVEQIDTQHKKLVGAIDELMEACTKGQGRTKIAQTLHFVAAYTDEHFRDEEALQAKVGYPQLSAHRQLHRMFIADVAALEAELAANGPSVALTASLNKKLIDWLIRHISTEDRKIGEYINAKSGT